MKITKVEIYQLGTELYPRWRPVVCRIYTDAGIYGDGEAALAANIGGIAAIDALRDFSEFIIGLDPLEHEVIWDLLYRGNWGPQNGGPVIYGAISAIDTALWDIKGKYYRVPVYSLLGGKRRDDLRCYASQLQFGWRKEEPIRTPEDYARVAKLAVEDGYDAVKIDFLQYNESGERFSADERTGFLTPAVRNVFASRLAAVREAIGPEVDIMVENHGYTDAQSVLQIAKLCEGYDVLCLEEPTAATPELTAYVASRTNIPIATGERIYSRWQFAPYLEQHSVQLLQPDIGNCGGITEIKKIADMAYVYDVGIQCHVGGTPLAVAAALQVEAVIPNFVIHEHHEMYLLSYTRELCVYDDQPVRGRFWIPDRPGIGNEFSEKALQKAARKEVVQ